MVSVVFMRLRGLVAVGLLTATVVGCSSSPSESGNVPKATDPCVLLTKAEAEQELGGSVSGPTADPQGPDGPTCTYDIAASASRVFAVIYREATTADQLRAETAPGEAVDGVGDAAYFFTNLGVLKVVSGTTFFAVGVLVNGQQSIEKSKTLAQAALARL